MYYYYLLSQDFILSYLVVPKEKSEYIMSDIVESCMWHPVIQYSVLKATHPV